jgi:hypothetical protein
MLIASHVPDRAQVMTVQLVSEAVRILALVPRRLASGCVLLTVQWKGNEQTALSLACAYVD